MCINITATVKSLLEAHALIEAHSPVWKPKMPNFQANFQKIEPTCNKGPLKDILKKSVLRYAETLNF